MELANIFLETDAGKVKLEFDAAHRRPCCGTPTALVDAAADFFMQTLDKYIIVEQSLFYMAVRNKDMFYYKCEYGVLSQVLNEFFVFDNVFLLATGKEASVSGVSFVITDQFPIIIRPRRRYAVHVYSNNTRFYAR
uniref:Virion core protein n=1 Tax=Rousettus bat poxvirus TaxID=3141933 RepID=A0AAU7E1Y8_9POXV